MKTLRILVKYFKINLSSAMEYRASFLGQAVGMVVSNAAFVLFWMIAFDRIGGAIGGYDFRDVMFLWSVTPFAFSSTSRVRNASNSIFARRILPEAPPPSNTLSSSSS